MLHKTQKFAIVKMPMKYSLVRIVSATQFVTFSRPQNHNNVIFWANQKVHMVILPLKKSGSTINLQTCAVIRIRPKKEK
jgi:hypothetical protein